MRIPKGYLTVSQVAERLYITENRARRWQKRGYLPSERLNDHRILFNEAIIELMIPQIWDRLGRGDYFEWLLNPEKWPMALLEQDEFDDDGEAFAKAQEEEFYRKNPDYNPDDYEYEKSIRKYNTDNGTGDPE
jgi:hypothetical protein